ncbi:hypothetical protein EVAR_8487_1 [Eumeta japonica]|uniref:Uncharacterized protein n=1 Tax=Eumeta variegata TaxID=151549 RepID=A0A4C1XKZ6_EUMVA|nr:hypothetical protein EVAR_8487_1 [Eumeta japonica]
MALPLPIPPCAKRDGLSSLGCEKFEYASTMATTLLAPVKTEREILEHSMSEDDPNANTQPPSEAGSEPRWGPCHRGAQELAELYSPDDIRRRACPIVGDPVLPGQLEHFALRRDRSTTYGGAMALFTISGIPNKLCQGDLQDKAHYSLLKGPQRTGDSPWVTVSMGSVSIYFPMDRMLVRPL